jgi:hypothetical protein
MCAVIKMGNSIADFAKPTSATMSQSRIDAPEQMAWPGMNVDRCEN